MIIQQTKTPLLLQASDGMEAELIVEVDGIKTVHRGKIIRVDAWTWRRQEYGGVASGDVVGAGARCTEDE